MKFFNTIPNRDEITDLVSLVKALPAGSILVGGTDINDYVGISLNDVDGNKPESGNGLLEIIKYSTSRNTIRISRCTAGSNDNIISETRYVSSSDSIAPWSTVSINSYKNLPLKNGITEAKNNYGGREKLGYCKIGSQVYVYGGAGITDFSDASIIAILPEGYRPITSHYYFASVGGEYISRVFINKNGEIIVEWIISLLYNEKYTGNVPWVDLSTSFPVS